MDVPALILAPALVVAVLVVLAVTGVRRHRSQQRWAVLRSTTDSLTGLLNRRGFEAPFTELVALNADLGRTVSLVLLDLDAHADFHTRNGRDDADRGVRRVANILTRLSRAVDLVGHLADDEFAVVLPGADAADALSFAERVAWALGSERVPVALRITASSGIGSVLPGEGPDELMARARDALRAAKHAGAARAAWWDGLILRVGEPVDVPEPIDEPALPPRPRELIMRRNDLTDEPERASA